MTRRRRMHRLVNAQRRQRGLPRLRWSEVLALRAAWQARRIRGRRELFHSDLSELGGLGFGRWGENVGVTSQGVPELHAAYMASEAHCANVLGRSFDRVGIGFARSETALYNAVIFGDVRA